jgi:hypothetical protein
VEHVLRILINGIFGIRILQLDALATAYQTVGDWGRTLLTPELELDLAQALGWSS